MRLQVPREGHVTFEPVLVPKRAGRVAGGLETCSSASTPTPMTVRDICHHVEQVYGTELSAPTVSRITDQVLEEVAAWQNRPLERCYSVVFLDAIVVRVRDHHAVANKPAYLAIGIDTDGEKHVLGIWVARPSPGPVAGEGAKFWRHVLSDLKNRGLADILIACCDGLSGFEDAISAVFPDTTVQTCIVHLIRNSLRPVPRREQAGVTAGLKPV